MFLLLLKAKCSFSNMFEFLAAFPYLNIKVLDDTWWSNRGLGKASELHPLAKWQVFDWQK